MNHDEYRNARKHLSMRVNDWIDVLGIALDTHKSYNSGRLAIQPPVANHIETLLKLDRLEKSVQNTQKSF